MNSMNTSFNGLAASLLLTVGLSKIAEKLDPMQKHSKSIEYLTSAKACEPCEASWFAPEAGL
jgi:hypothetical protein